ncbi:MAG: GNAT family N-acetyltransferase [Fimbriimonadaceae bacterium]
MLIRLVHVTDEENHAVLARLCQLYLHDLSEFSAEDLNATGNYTDLRPENVREDDRLDAYLVQVAGELAGFVVVRQLATGECPRREIEDFFIVRKYRRLGVGTDVATEIFRRMPGLWRVASHEANHASQGFWRALLKRVVRTDYHETTVGGPHQRLVQEFKIQPEQCAD